MKKTKKLLSLLIAMAIAMSAFAGLTVTSYADDSDPAAPVWKTGTDGSGDGVFVIGTYHDKENAMFLDAKNVYTHINDVSEGVVEFNTDVYLDAATARTFRIILQNKQTGSDYTSATAAETVFAQAAVDYEHNLYVGPATGNEGSKLLSNITTAGWYNINVKLDYDKLGTEPEKFITVTAKNSSDEQIGEETFGALDGKDTNLNTIRLVTTAADAYFANMTVTPGSALAPVEPEETETPKETDDPNDPGEPMVGVNFDFESADQLFVASGSHTAQYNIALEKVESDTVNTTTVLHAHLDNQTGGRNAQIKFPKGAIKPGAKDVVDVNFDWYTTCTGAENSQDVILIDDSAKEIIKLRVLASGAIELNESAVSGLTAGTWYKISAVLDFETKRIVKIDFVPYTSEDGTPVAAITDIPFADAAASDIAGFTLQGNRKNNISSDIRIDNFSADTTKDAYYIVTIVVADKDGKAVPEATLTLKDTVYTTDAEGKIVTKLAPGEYAYTVHKAGYEATQGQADDAKGTITVTDAEVTENVTYSEQVYEPVPKVVTMTGGQTVMTAPHSADTTTSKAYELTVIDQAGVKIEDADIAWTVTPADDKVSVADGIVTVAKGFDAGETHAKDFVVTATATKNGESESATANLAISDYLFYEPGVGGSSYGETNVSGGYIATPSNPNKTNDLTNTITLPDPITFTKGTAQLVKFKTAVNHATGYTFKRTVEFADSTGTNSVAFGYVDLVVGDAATATWDSSKSTLATTWGEMTAINTWIDISILYKTNANDVTSIVLTVDGKEYELGATDATGIAAIKLVNSLQDPGRYAMLKDITIEEIDVTGLEIAGPKAFSTIANTTITKNYQVDAMVIEDGETFTWSTDIEGATITADPEDSQKAVLSVPGTVTNGGKITLTSSVEGKSATLDVEIAPAEIKSVSINGTPTLDKADGTATYTVSDVIDQFGDDVTEYFTPVWSLSAKGSTGSGSAAAVFTVDADDAGEAVAIKAVYSDTTLTSVTTEDVTLVEGENTIAAPAGTKVMLWKALDGEGALEPITEAKVAAAVAGDDEEITNATIDPTTGVVTITGVGDIAVTATLTNGDKSYSFSKDVTIGTFSAVVDAEDGTTAVDISAINADDMITGYEVTVAKDNAEVSSKVVPVADVQDGKITVESTAAGQKVEVAPVYEGVIGDTFNIPGGRYNITVVAGTADRTDVFVNDQMIINNLNQGSDNWSVARTKVDNAEYVAGDVMINEGSAVFNLRDDKGGIASAKKIKVVKAPSIVARKQRVYVFGDSLVAKYYGNAPEGQEALVRTGWGDVLADYLVDTVNITNLGNSGVEAIGLLGDAFSSIRMSAQPGDIFILESGYNDKSESAMKESVITMVTEAKAKGMTVFVVTPNSSSHSANEYNGNVSRSAGMREAAATSEANLIDLAANSSKFFHALYGSSLDDAKATLTAYYNNANDSLHSSYNAANCWAAVVANGLLNNDATKDIVNTTYTYHFDDGTTDGVTVGANLIPGVTAAE
ncbi:MAG: hypothetical protein J1F01_02300 [Oscillospiraceae bacterium]|nr:hypothetical protein [Oscillospiraceae bacterium]